MGTSSRDLEGPGGIAEVIASSFITYVRRARGPDAAARVAGSIDRSLQDLDETAWFTTGEVLTLARAAAEECGDHDIGRRAAEANFAVLLERGMGDFLVAAGSPVAAMKTITEFATRFSTSRWYAVTEDGPTSLVIESECSDSSFSNRVFCSFSAAYFSLVPSVFGFAGTTAEVACQLRGDPRCRFEVQWRPDPRAQAPDVLASAARNGGVISAYEAVRVMAGELARARDVPAALDLIVDQANLALVAPRYVLSVSVGDGQGLSVHQSGFPDDVDLDALARQAIDGTLDGHDVLVVEVTSARHEYGHLSAVFPAGRTFTDADRRLLAGYAAHAAGALDALVALDSARRDRDTSGALLDLAHALARVTTSDEMVERLARAIIPTVACTSASVWLAGRTGLALGAVAGSGVQVAGVRVLVPDVEMQQLAASTMSDGPAILDVGSVPAALRASMGDVGVARVAMAPLVVRQELLGIAAAGFPAGGATSDSDLLARLAALADQAATALDNARLLEQARHGALHDSLTGLPNRTLIEDRVDAALRRAGRTGWWPSLLFVDLDRFKNVNDTLGHGAGDELIRGVADRLQTVMRDSDTLGRLGGDEFVVLLDGPDGVVDAQLVAERFVASMREPFTIGGHELFISCSVGIASGPDDGTTYERLLKHADRAMYVAKGLGRGTFATYTSPRAGSPPANLDLESQLHRAVQNGELVVLYQPQVDLGSSAVVGVEALVRWDHPTLGRLTPSHFLPLAEESGVIVELDRWVRAEAFAQTRRWHDEGNRLRIAVNLSTRDLQKVGLADRISREAAAAGIPLGAVEVEVTERVVMDDGPLSQIVRELRDAGLRVAMDDFGTGTSVLTRLTSCPVNTLKIDRTIVAEVDSPHGHVVVRALMVLGQGLALDVLAEGIETEDQLELLRGLGCTFGQGYLLGHPMSAAEVSALAARTLAAHDAS